MPLPRKDKSTAVWDNGVSYLPPMSKIPSLKHRAAALAAASIDRAPEVCTVRSHPETCAIGWRFEGGVLVLTYLGLEHCRQKSRLFYSDISKKSRKKDPRY